MALLFECNQDECDHATTDIGRANDHADRHPTLKDSIRVGQRCTITAIPNHWAQRIRGLPYEEQGAAWREAGVQMRASGRTG